MSNKLFLENITFGYGKNIYQDFSMQFPIGEVSVILGRSGCGKTSLLNLISGLLAPIQGNIVFDTALAKKKKLGYIFQEPRLLPWRTISKNIEIILKKDYCPAERRKIAEKYLKMVGLGEYINSYPDVLSGGMKQRASIARAFAYPSDIILMDEPFQSIDLKLKIDLMNLFTKLWIDDRRTAILVTHNIEEAVLLGDNIFVFSNSRPVQIIENIKNREPHTQRTPGTDNSIKIQRMLYKKIISEF